MDRRYYYTDNQYNKSRVAQRKKYNRKIYKEKCI